MLVSSVGRTRCLLGISYVTPMEQQALSMDEDDDRDPIMRDLKLHHLTGKVCGGRLGLGVVRWTDPPPPVVLFGIGMAQLVDEYSVLDSEEEEEEGNASVGPAACSASVT